MRLPKTAMMALTITNSKLQCLVEARSRDVGERLDGGREISRPVNLETIPLYVRAGPIPPLGPVKQFTAQKFDGSLSVSIYPGGDAAFLLYEDDRSSFHYRKGEWMGIQMNWDDAGKKLNLHLTPGSRMLTPEGRVFTVHLGEATQSVAFEGQPAEVSFKLRR